MSNKKDIEEDIKKLKEEISRVHKINHLTATFVPINILENILADRERLEKENEDYKIKENSRIAGKYNEIEIHALIEQTIQKDYIAKANKYDSLIKEIEDKINKEELPLVIVGGRRNCKTLNYGIKLGRIKVLQELLDTEKEKI